MKNLILFVVFIYINPFVVFAQTRVDIGEVYGAKLEKTANITKQAVYQINAQTLLNAPKSGNNQTEVRMSLFNEDYEIVLRENIALENAPAYYTDKNGILHQEYPSVKLYAGHLKSDSSKYVRLSVMDGKYVNGYINVGDDFLYLSSCEENRGNTIAYFGKDIVAADNLYSCGTLDPEPDTLDNSIIPMATDLYDFESVIRIMKIAADADEDFYNLYGSNFCQS